MKRKILLGYEVAIYDDEGKLKNPDTVGQAIYIHPRHLAVFGMTQDSGKTTTIEALVHRKGTRAIAFLTKRGEAGFTQYNMVPAYYEEESGWRYVESLVNVALGEKVKYEPRMRYAIMRVSKGKVPLRKVRARAEAELEKAKREWDKEVMAKLIAYLDLVLPELEAHAFTDKIDLQDGVNVMNLVGMKLETQMMVIASTIKYVYEHLNNVIVVIPEAWEQLPQSRMTPVKYIAEQFIRKGASVGNFLWLDSQDIGGIDKTPLRQVNTWIMGRMMEAHEVERIIKQLLGFKVPAKEIQTLPLGHFYATVGKEVKKVYVLPIGVPDEDGIKVAKGELGPEEIRDKYLKPKTFGEMQSEALTKVLEDYEWTKKELDAVRDERDDLKQTLEGYNEKVKNLQQRLTVAVDQYSELAKKYDALIEEHNELTAINPLADIIRGVVRDEIAKNLESYKTFGPDVEDFLKDKIEEILEHPEQFDITVKSPQTKLIVEKPLHLLVLSTENHQGMIATLYADGKLPNGWFTTKAVMDLYMARGMKRNPRTIEYLKDLCKWGFLESRVEGKKAREFRVSLPPDEARQKGLLLVKEVKP